MITNELETIRFQRPCLSKWPKFREICGSTSKQKAALHVVHDEAMQAPSAAQADTHQEHTCSDVEALAKPDELWA